MMMLLRTRRGAAGLMAVLLSLGSLTTLSYVGNHAYIAYQRDTIRSSLDAAGKILAHDQMAREAKLAASGLPVTRGRDAEELQFIAQNLIDANTAGSGIKVQVDAVALTVTPAREMTVAIDATLNDDSDFGMGLPFMTGMFGDSIKEFRSETVWKANKQSVELVVLLEASARMLRPLIPRGSDGTPVSCGEGAGSWYAQKPGQPFLGENPEHAAGCRRSRLDVAADVVREELLGGLNAGESTSSPMNNQYAGISVAFVPYGETVNLENNHYSRGNFRYRKRINRDRVNFEHIPGQYPPHPYPKTWAGCVEVKPGQNAAEQMNGQVSGVPGGPNINHRSSGADKFWDVSYRDLGENPGLTAGFLNAWNAPDVLSRVHAQGADWNPEIGAIVHPGALFAPPRGEDEPLPAAFKSGNDKPDEQGGRSSALRSAAGWTPPVAIPAGYERAPKQFYDEDRPLGLGSHHSMKFPETTWLGAEAVYVGDPTQPQSGGLLGPQSPWHLWSQFWRHGAPDRFPNFRWRMTMDMTWYRDHAHGASQSSLFEHTKDAPRYMGHNQGCHRMPIVPLTYDFGHANGWIEQEIKHVASSIDEISRVSPTLGLVWAGRVLSPAWNTALDDDAERKRLWLMSDSQGETLHRHIPIPFLESSDTLDPSQRKIIVWITATDPWPLRWNFAPSTLATSGTPEVLETHYGGQPLPDTPGTPGTPNIPGFPNIPDIPNIPGLPASGTATSGPGTSGMSTVMPRQRTAWAFMPMREYGALAEGTIKDRGFGSGSGRSQTSRLGMLRNQLHGPWAFGYSGPGSGDRGYLCRFSSWQARGESRPAYLEGTWLRDGEPGDRMALSALFSTAKASYGLSGVEVVTDRAEVHCITPRRPVVWCRPHGTGYRFYSSLTNTASSWFRGSEVQRAKGYPDPYDRLRVYLGRNILGAAPGTGASGGQDSYVFDSAFDDLVETGQADVPQNEISGLPNIASACGSIAGHEQPILYCEHWVWRPGKMEPFEGLEGLARYAATISSESGVAIEAVSISEPRTVALHHRMWRADAYRDCGFGIPDAIRGNLADPVVEMLALAVKPDGSPPSGVGGTAGDFVIAGRSLNTRFVPAPKGHVTLPGYTAYGRIRYQFEPAELAEFNAAMPPGDFGALYAAHLDSFAHSMLLTPQRVSQRSAALRKALRGPTTLIRSDGVPQVDQASLILGYRTNNRFASSQVWRDASTRTTDANYRTHARAMLYLCRELQHYGVDLYGVRIVSDINNRSYLAHYDETYGQAACFDVDPELPSTTNIPENDVYPGRTKFFAVDTPGALADVIDDIKRSVKRQLIQVDVMD